MLIVASSCPEGGAAESLVADGGVHRMWHNSFGLAVPSDSLTAGIYGSAIFTSVSRAILDADRLRKHTPTSRQSEYLVLLLRPDLLSFQLL